MKKRNVALSCDKCHRDIPLIDRDGSAAATCPRLVWGRFLVDLMIDYRMGLDTDQQLVTRLGHLCRKCVRLLIRDAEIVDGYWPEEQVCDAAPKEN